VVVMKSIIFWNKTPGRKMEAICSSETSVQTQRTTRRHIPEDDTLQVQLKCLCIIHEFYATRIAI
jgi:hypothetical protein